MQEKDNILKILASTKEAIKDGDIPKIKNLSNQTTNTAVLDQDPENITVAVIVYSLSKILEREQYHKLPGWDSFYNIYIKAIDKTILALQKNDDKELTKNLELIRTAIHKLSGKLKIYIQDVFIKARINKASNLYSHGISMEKTAKLLGITLFDLANYAGQTDLPEVTHSKALDVKARIKLAMDMFQ